jgi:PTS system beta-glucosides-specific IIC component
MSRLKSIFATEFATNGFSYFGAIVFFVAAMGQTGAVFAIAAKTKIKNIKSVTMGAGISRRKTIQLSTK